MVLIFYGILSYKYFSQSKVFHRISIKRKWHHNFLREYIYEKLLSNKTKIAKSTASKPGFFSATDWLNLNCILHQRFHLHRKLKHRCLKTSQKYCLSVLSKLVRFLFHRLFCWLLARCNSPNSWRIKLVKRIIEYEKTHLIHLASSYFLIFYLSILWGLAILMYFNNVCTSLCWFDWNIYLIV